MRASGSELVRARWAVAVMFLVNGFIMGSWAPQIPLLLPRHGLTAFGLGLLILGLGLGAVAAMALAGGLIARFGSRVVLRGFAVAASGTLAAVVLAPTLALLALAMVGMGGLIGCMDVAMNANAVEVERRLGRAIMSSSHGFWSLGGFLGGSLGGVLIAALGSGGHALVVSAVALALVGLAAPHLRGAPPVPHPPTAAGGAGSHWPRGGAIYLLGLMALGAMVPEGAVLDWSALYLARELGSPVAASGLAFAGFAAAMAVMRFAGDHLRNRHGAATTLRVSGAVAAAGLLAASLAPTAPLAIAGFALAGLGIANMVPIILSAAGNHPGLGAGVGISVVTMMGYSGILVAPASIGLVADHIGFRLTYAVLALVLIGVAALARRVAAADQRHRPVL
ncbi:MAG: MFS transporter [Alphaproteobacteria bacterium]|nr:MFS transporter [Alphaproteobacteria bacterium]